jgi:hypothetical protein
MVVDYLLKFSHRKEKNFANFMKAQGLKMQKSAV